MRRTKKVLSLLVALCMVSSLLPVPVAAEGAKPGEVMETSFVLTQQGDSLKPGEAGRVNFSVENLSDAMDDCFVWDWTEIDPAQDLQLLWTGYDPGDGPGGLEVEVTDIDSDNKNLPLTVSVTNDGSAGAVTGHNDEKTETLTSEPAVVWVGLTDLYVNSVGDDEGFGTLASPYATLSKAFEVINSADSSDTAPVTVHVMDDLTMGEVVTLTNTGKQVTLLSDNDGDLTDDDCFTVTRGVDKDLFTVNRGTLTLENITIDGDKNGSFSDSKGALVLVYYGALTVKTGATLQNNAREPNTTHSSGVHIDSGTLTMTGGEIRNNKSRYGGGVTAYPGTFTMTGGSITGNSAIESGGGVHLDKGSTFTMTGGSITGNSCGGGYYGGGVNVGYGGEDENRIAVTLGGENATAITIKDNKCGTTANNNLSISQSNYATVTLGDLAPDSSIGISARKPPTADASVTLATSTTTTGISDGAMEYFFSDSTAHRLLRSEDKQSLLLATLPVPNLKFDDPGPIIYDGAKVTVGESGTSNDLTYNIGGNNVSIKSVNWYDKDGNRIGSNSSSGPTDAGTYKLVLTTQKVANQYSEGTFEKEFTISSREISMTGSAVTTKEYDGTDAATITPGELNDVLDADKDKVSVKESSIVGTFASANAGADKEVTTTNAFTLEGDRASNYTLTQPTGLTGEITKKPVTLTIVAASRPYEKDNVTVDLTGATITVNGKVNNDDVTANLTDMTGTMDDDAKGTGKTVHLSGTASLTGTKVGNYVLNTQPATATVDIISATWEDKSTTVSERPDVEKTVELADLIAPGGRLGAPSESGSMLAKCERVDNKLVFKIKNDVAENETTTVTVPVTNATNYDDYDITVTIKALAKLSISQDVLDAITGYSGTYDAKAHNAVVKGDAVTEEYTLTYRTSETGEYNSTMPTVTNVADSKTVWVKVSRPGYADATKSVNVTVSELDINRAMITLNKIPTYSGNEETVTVASVTVGSGDTAVTLAAGDYTVSGDKATNVETKTLTVTGQTNCTGEAQIDWSLEQKAITDATIILGTQATYDGQSHDVVISKVALSGYADLVAGADKDYTITAGGSATNVEDTTLEITGRGNFTGTKTVSWKLEKAETTVGCFTLPDLSEAKTYSGSSISVTAPTPADGKTGLGAVTVYYAGRGTTNYSKDTQAPTNAGTYTVTFDVAEGTNYKAVNGLTIGTLTINPKEVVIKALDKTAMVDDSVPSLDNPVKDTDYTVEGLVGSDELTGHSVKLAYASTPDMSQPGECGITPSAAAENNNTNYTIRYVDGKLIVGGIVLPGKDTQMGTVDDVTVKPGAGASATKKDDGSYDVSDPGGTVEKPEGTITVTGDFNVKPDGTITLPEGSTATTDDGKIITGPAIIKPDGEIEVGEGGTVDTDGDGDADVTGPAIVHPDGTVTKAYTVTVNGSYAAASGAGTYDNGTTVTVYAGSRSGYTFNGWTSSDVTVSAASGADFSFTMPAKNVTLTANWSYNGGGGSSSSGGSGSGGTTYPPTVKDPDHGDVTVSPKNPSKGETVIIRPDPDKGYEVDDVVVTKPDGSKVPVKDNGNGTWTFEQPSGKVTVKVTFKPVTAAGGSTYDKCPGGSSCPLSAFTDTSTTAWYHDGVHYCIDNGLMNGKSATVFDPNGTTTRGQIVTILWRLEGSPKVDAADFTDVASGLYYTDAVAWAAANGIVTGYTDGTFKPNTPITREQMATILYRYCKYKGLTVSAAADLSGFADRNRIAPYAEEALAWANAVGLVNGKSASALDPTGSATRAQVATILMRFCVNIVKK